MARLAKVWGNLLVDSMNVFLLIALLVVWGNYCWNWSRLWHFVSFPFYHALEFYFSEDRKTVKKKSR